MNPFISLSASAFLIALISAQPVASVAQSLDSRNPTPVRAGENRGTVDNMIGAQYWSIACHAGKVNIMVSFASMGLFGSPQTTTMGITLHDATGKALGSQTLTSNGKTAQLTWPGSCKDRTTFTLELRPPGGMALVRAGGDYSISANGDGVEFPAATAAGVDKVVGTYAVMQCAADFDCQNGLAIRFLADGTVKLTDGHNGRWTLFDPASMVYAIVIGPDRYSLKLAPGRGLFNTNDLATPIFQAVRPN
jgi:hypothetical protein